MKRITITNTPTWFNADTATVFEGKQKFWNKNFNEFCYETLYGTKKGAWVIYIKTEGSCYRASYSVISDKEALEWFLRHNFQDREIPISMVKDVSNYEI